ncbi:hypothetical protein Micbo1qcDRAFT_140343 [Microdochium bolleyi]|uniref:Uncharacterized protein n=1 Tax=Microdochium bolleyi TaxID=196109 RepID=A0A136INC8_9PEZI|nr:hypothetical protein Micbo1qcDRAFT_140343 [Microdochium bolleyi]
MSAQEELYRLLNRHASRGLADKRAALQPYDRSEAQDHGDIRSEDVLEFDSFEKSFHDVVGDQMQKEVNDSHMKDVEDELVPVRAEVKAALSSQLAEYGSQIHFKEDPNLSAEPVEKVYQFAKSINDNGRASNVSFLDAEPASALEWAKAVYHQTKLHKGLEFLWRWNPLATASNELDYELVSSDGEIPEKLYGFLSARICSEKQHQVLLRLSGFRGLGADNILPDAEQTGHDDYIFHLALACTVGEESERATLWHRASCKYSSKEPPHPWQGKICDEVLRPDNDSDTEALALDFSNHKLWLGDRPQQPPRGQENEFTNLRHLLGDPEKCYRGINDNARMLQVARLAFELTSSLHQLYPGRWIQDVWHVGSLKTSLQTLETTSSKMHNAYIACKLGRGMDRQCFDIADDFCRRFFLSFAQLLVDIVVGKSRTQQENATTLNDWSKSLKNDVDKKLGANSQMQWYAEAVRGCLKCCVGSREFVTARQWQPDDRSTFRKLISEKVLSKLRTNLALWEGTPTLPEIRELPEEASHSPRPGASSQTDPVVPNQPTAQNIPSGEIARSPCPGYFTLWSKGDGVYQVRSNAECETKGSFTTRMDAFVRTHIREKTIPSPNSGYRRVRIAVLDTGYYFDPLLPDPILHQAERQKRIEIRRNFHNDKNGKPDPGDWKDRQGHGTQVARLIRRFAPEAEIVIARIANDQSFGVTDTNKCRLIEALQWAGENADIINLSWGLGVRADSELCRVVDALVDDGKLIFAAASNQGGFGARTWPASHVKRGVFCIYATDEDSEVPKRINPPACGIQDNFSILGCDVESYWDGKYRTITGTSFASPIAAAAAANVIELARRTLSPVKADRFLSYPKMRGVFATYMARNTTPGEYHVLYPWTEKLWESCDTEKVREKLNHIAGRI